MLILFCRFDIANIGRKITKFQLFASFFRHYVATNALKCDISPSFPRNLSHLGAQEAIKVKN